MEGQSTGRRVTMAEAADELGLSVEAIRKRVQRKTLTSDKGEDGRRYVYLDDVRDESRPKASAESSGELVEVLRAQVEDLRGRLDKETEANRENRRIIAGLIERVPELEAPRGSRQSDEDSAERPGGEGRPVAEAGREQPERRPWWRRVFGSS